MNKQLTKRDIDGNHREGMHICGLNFGYTYSISTGTHNAQFNIFSYDKKVCTLWIYAERSSILSEYELWNAGDFRLYMICWDAWKYSPTTTRQTREALEEIERVFGWYSSKWNDYFTRLDVEKIMRRKKS